MKKNIYGERERKWRDEEKTGEKKKKKKKKKKCAARQRLVPRTM